MNPVALFDGCYTCAEDYENAGVRAISPMLAKELEDEEKQDACLNSTDYYIEEKFDGTRATLHFYEEFTRCFSRRVSEKTGWFCENSDSVPHIRDLKIPELAGTIIDGEMFIPNRPFKDVSSTLNCRERLRNIVCRPPQNGTSVRQQFRFRTHHGVFKGIAELHTHDWAVLGLDNLQRGTHDRTHRLEHRAVGERIAHSRLEHALPRYDTARLTDPHSRNGAGNPPVERIVYV